MPPGRPPGAGGGGRGLVAALRRHILVAAADGRVTGTVTPVIVPDLAHGGRPRAAAENVVVAADARGA